MLLLLFCVDVLLNVCDVVWVWLVVVCWVGPVVVTDDDDGAASASSNLLEGGGRALLSAVSSRRRRGGEGPLAISVLLLAMPCEVDHRLYINSRGTKWLL